MDSFVKVFLNALIFFPLFLFLTFFYVFFAVVAAVVTQTFSLRGLSGHHPPVLLMKALGHRCFFF